MGEVITIGLDIAKSEIALRRIAEGMVETKDMHERHLERLKLLALIKVTGKDFRLTSLGYRRYAMVEKAGDQT